MKNKCLAAVMALFVITHLNAQIGVGTTTPNSTLDVRGSLSTSYRAFATATAAAITDNMLVFTGTSAATLTLPDAVTCSGRVYWVKNTSSNASTLTVATTSSQTIDGLASWTITQTNKSIRLVSNGANWLVAAESVPGNSAGTAWIYGGNNVGAIQNIGTTSNFDLPFITNNTEKMRVSAAGNVAIGATSFNGTNPEKLLVNAGTTSSVNAIVGKGTINSYLQLNIQNNSSGAAASSDVVATADNGNETSNFVDMGINSSGYSATGILGGANNAYLYTTGNDFVIGNSTNNRSLIFYTAASSTNTERMRITSAGLLPGQDNTYSSGNTTNRWTAVWAANGTIQTSDIRLKKNIHPLLYGLDDVMKLQPVSYDWKDNSGSNKIGLIAQDVRKVIPQVVVGDETKENLGMNYAELVPVLINAIKELKLEFNDVKRAMDEMKKK